LSLGVNVKSAETSSIQTEQRRQKSIGLCKSVPGLYVTWSVLHQFDPWWNRLVLALSVDVSTGTDSRQSSVKRSLHDAALGGESHCVLSLPIISPLTPTVAIWVHLLSRHL